MQEFFFLYYRDLNLEQAVWQDCFRDIKVVIRNVWRFYLSAIGKETTDDKASNKANPVTVGT